MRKWSLVPLAVLALQASDRIAAAQPGADTSDPAPYPPPPPEPEPQPQPQPQPQPYPQPQPQPSYAQPYAPGGFVPVQLTPDEHELLQRGEITDGAHIGGVAASLLLGLGVGQAVQGRYMETGWIFTVGELASMTALIIGVGQALDDTFTDGTTRDTGRGDGLIIGGLVGLVVFRAWEVVDAFTGPPKHNRKVRDLKMRLGMPVPLYTHRVVPYINRTRDSGATAGVVFRF